MSEDSTHRTRFDRVVDNKRFRLFFTGFISVVFLGDLILAALSFHIYPSEVDGALAYQVILSIATFAYSVFFLWRNLDGCTKKRAWTYFCLNLAVIVCWLAAFFSLVIELGKTGTPNSSSSNSNRKRQNNSSNNTQQTSSFYPAIGCVVLDLFVVGVFLVNLIYIYFRITHLFPKYAELNEDGHASNTEMEQNEGRDEEEGHETHDGPQNQAQDAYASYGAYEGQEDYRPGGHYTPPRRYGAEADSETQPPAYGYQGQSDYGQQGQNGYAQHVPRYPAAAAYEETSYAGQTAYSQHQHPGARVSPTPYPRDSVIGM